MKVRILSAAALALTLAACGSDDDSPAPPTSVPIDEAQALVLTLHSLGDDATVVFTLEDGAGLAVTGAEDYAVTYLGYPGTYDTAFSMPWHTGERFGCGQLVPDCLGKLVEDEPGHYSFTPDRAPALGDRSETVKLLIQVFGAQASTPPEVLDPPAPEA
ncbi:Spi family protease inhibitor [Ferrimonas balearica]|uniref:Spi family protease inhibitor n=1 Tax=Ferrimonas balearica TaxID=44012 RepID=UPI001C99FECC|nr:Spi family protease inhibitor [Ferrimonas balearica]MBY5922939.1 Spi family protease inhibitor [Ferrimonas balearica]MBY5997684.1 Spi family protease inhibitor [Ferrimonas balearica]